MSATETTTEVVALADQAQPPAAPILGDLPAVPADSEMRALFQLANVFAASHLVPKDLRHQPNDCLLVMMTARDLGLSLTVAFRECHVVDGKVTTSPKLRKAIVQARGLGRIWPDPGNDQHSATWHAVRADDPDTTYTSTFTWDDAKRPTGRNQLVGPNCTPDQHRPGQGGKCGCKDNYRNYPQRQLSWRALGYLMDDAFSEVATGLYSPDEIGAVTDEDGRPIIDVVEVGVPEGMTAPRAARQPEAPPPASADQVAELRDRIKALPDDALADLRERWTQPRSEEAGGGPTLPVDAEGRPATGLLNARSIRTADALVKSFERDVEHGKYGQQAAEVEPLSDEEEAAIGTALAEEFNRTGRLS